LLKNVCIKIGAAKGFEPLWQLVYDAGTSAFSITA